MTKNFFNKKGVTLVELATVLALVGIISTLAVPNFRRQVKIYKFKEDAEMLTMTIKLARVRAITSKVNHAVVIDPSAKTLTVYKDPYGSNIQIGNTLTFKKINYIWHNFVDNKLIFNPRGAVLKESINNGFIGWIGIWNIDWGEPDWNYHGLWIYRASGLIYRHWYFS